MALDVFLRPGVPYPSAEASILEKLATTSVYFGCRVLEVGHMV